MRLGQSPRDKFSILWRETKNIRVRLHLAHYAPTAIYTLRTTRGPLYFRDNFGDITNVVNLFYRQVYSPPGKSLTGPILDIGANIGLAAAWFSSCVPGSAIYCFEPVAANAELISLNCPSAQVVRAAVGRQRGHIGLRLDPDQVMASRIPCRWRTDEHVFDLVALDEVAMVRALPQVGLMKIDVEGMELDVLEGGPETLAKTEQLVMETHGKAVHTDVIALLRRSGLDIQLDSFTDQTGFVFASRLAPDSQTYHSALVGI
jgi:FkbM family methyltransferase